MSRNNFYIDTLKPFTITLKRYITKRLGKVVQWSFRSWKHLVITGVILLVAVVGAQKAITAWQADEEAPAQEPAPALEHDEDEGLSFREVEAEPLESASPSASASASDESTGPDMGGNDQAADPEAGTKPSHEQQDVAQPSEPEADRSKPENTAEALATAYLSRGEGDEWKGWVADLTNDKLSDHLADADTPLDGRGASEVTDVTISDEPFEGAPNDSPLRWSREVEATVKTETGGTLLLRFEATLMLNEDEQWEATDFAQTTWKAEV